VAAYIASQIGQNAQSVQTTVAALRCSRRNRYRRRARRPKAPACAWKKAFIWRWRPFTLGAAGQVRPA